MNAVVFDLDGTLVDTVPDIQIAVNVWLGELGRKPLALNTVRTFIGHGIPHLVRSIMDHCDLDPAKSSEFILRFKELYSANPSAMSREYQGVTDLLRALTDQGVPLGVCTNKSENIANQILKDLGLRSYFGIVVGGNTLPVKKPDAAPLKHAFAGLATSGFLFVGDSEVGAQTALAADVPFALFSGGYRAGPISSIPNDFVFDSFTELTDRVQSGSILEQSVQEQA